jgi:hypothetical protein
VLTLLHVVPSPDPSLLFVGRGGKTDINTVQFILLASLMRIMGRDAMHCVSTLRAKRAAPKECRRHDLVRSERDSSGAAKPRTKRTSAPSRTMVRQCASVRAGMSSHQRCEERTANSPTRATKKASERRLFLCAKRLALFQMKNEELRN